ncbi:MAG: hypothetical protein FWG34_10605 [Oscillospiraceae bacterium]|nr:hypothetical protein [Oscillospiraceae bacterium]
MENNGREDRLENDLFFVCSVIEHIGRTTKNKRGEVAAKLGEAEISRLLEFADVLHCEPIEIAADDLIKRCGLTEGNYDNVASCTYAIPTHFDIAKVYKRLIASISSAQNIAPPNALMKVYTSWISEKIDDYNSSMYYESPQYLYASYNAGKAIED